MDAARDHGRELRRLPDLLAPGLDVVFVAINPNDYALANGHYFASPSNRFWRAFSRSTLSARMRTGLGRPVLRPMDDSRLPEFGIGMTFQVWVPTDRADQLTPAVYREWAPRLVERLRLHAPKVACFHGKTGYAPFVRYGLGRTCGGCEEGLQPIRLDGIRLFVTPNPSGLNRHFGLDDIVAWYDRLADEAAI